MHGDSYPNSLKPNHWEKQHDKTLNNAIVKSGLVAHISEYYAEYTSLSNKDDRMAKLRNHETVAFFLDHNLKTSGVTSRFFAANLQKIIDILDRLLSDATLDETAKVTLFSSKREISQYKEHTDKEHAYFTKEAKIILAKLKLYFANSVGNDIKSCSDFRDSLIFVHEAPSLLELNNALICGEKYLSFVRRIYIFIRDHSTSQRDFIAHELQESLKHEREDTWTRFFSEYKPNEYSKWTDRINKLKQDHEHASPKIEFTVPKAIALLTSPAFSRKELLGEFENAIKNVLRKLETY